MDILKSAIELLSSKEPKKSNNKFTPVNLREYNKNIDTSAKRNTTAVVPVKLMSKKQASQLKAKKDAQEIARRNQAIATSQAAKNKPFSAQQLAEETGAIGDKLRLFPNDPNSIIDEYLNPGVMIGNMASSLGSLPKDIKEGKIGKAALSVAAPLALGALGGLGGSKTKTQFLNEVLNPLAGTKDLALSLTGKRGGKIVETLKKINEYSPFYVEPEVKAARQFHKEELNKLLNTKEGNRRLEDMGINVKLAKKNKPSLTFNEKLNNKYSPTYGVNLSDRNILEGKGLGVIPENMSKKELQSHELGHWLQDMYVRSNPDVAKRYIQKYNEQKEAYKAFEKLSDVEKAAIKNKPLPPKKQLLQDLILPSHIDEMAKSLKMISLSPDDYSSKAARSYFGGSYDANDIGEKIDIERVPFLREARQQMKDQGLIKDIHNTPIDENILKKFIEENRSTNRLASILRTDPNTLKTLADIYKILPAAGAGVATTLSTAKEKNKK